MAREVVERVGQRIAEHVDAHELKDVRIVLHGGEPLLVGAEAVAGLADILRAQIAVDAAFSIQTNGVLLDERALDVLAAARVRVGVSLDGGSRDNDRHRRYANGRGSFAAVDRALRLLTDRPEVFAGILGVVDLRTDPVEMYETFLGYAPPSVDFLLPHGNWTSPPPDRPPNDSTPYGDWLIRLFERWWTAPRQETGVRLLEETVNLVLGGDSRTEAVGLSPVATMVVDVDGAMEQVDTLRSAYVGAVGTSLNVFDNTFDEALAHPGVVARQIGLRALADTCTACPVHRVCGGGYYPHRYAAGSGFRNPSVYCADLKRLIEHVVSRVRADRAALQGAHR